MGCEGGATTPQSCIQSENLRAVGKFNVVLKKPYQSEGVKLFVKTEVLSEMILKTVTQGQRLKSINS